MFGLCKAIFRPKFTTRAAKIVEVVQVHFIALVKKKRACARIYCLLNIKEDIYNPVMYIYIYYTR